ncbi:hypothetical protein [Flavitalea sp.]|nr:hypothetical protein [Flavitalea sp.]
MDSKLIFIKSNKLLPKVAWESTPDFGWRYCGRSDDLEVALLHQAFLSHLSTNLVYFVPDRNNSKLVANSEVFNLIAYNIDKIEMAFWNENFTKVIELKTFGVFRLGEVFAELGM